MTEFDEDLSTGYHSLPDAKKRAKMSVLQIAEEMASREKDSPPYIVLSHELSMKLAREQSEATRSAGWLAVWGAIAAAVLSFGLGLFVGKSPYQETPKDAVTQTRCNCNCTNNALPFSHEVKKDEPAKVNEKNNR